MPTKKPNVILKELRHGVNQTDRDIMIDILDSAAQLTPGTNVLPTSDPAEAGALFVTGSETMGLGGITGSGFKVFCVSQG